MTSDKKEMVVPLDVGMSGVSNRVNSVASDRLWFSDETHFNLEVFVNKQSMRFWTSEKIIHTVVEASLDPGKCTAWCAISRQGLIGSIFVEGTIITQRYLRQLQNGVILIIQGAGHVKQHFSRRFVHASIQRM
jgi:hypothetical protein